MNKYIFDTSALKDAYSRHYRIKNFPTFWTKFANIIENSECYFLDKVMDEIKNMASELYLWLKGKNIKIASSLDGNIIKCQKNIMEDVSSKKMYVNNYKKWDIDEVADSWIIAYAKVNNCIIVTHEQPVYNEKMPDNTIDIKIPDVAKTNSIKYIRIEDFIDDVNIII